MAITTTHHEVHDWPIEDYTYVGCEHRRHLRCAWGDRMALAIELDTYPDSVYPYDSSGAILSRIVITPEKNSKHTDAGSGMISYNHAILHCDYSTKWARSGAYLLSEDLSIATEANRWSHEGLYWDASGATELVKGEGPQRLTAMLSYTLQYHRLAAVPAAVLTLPGYINSNTVATKILGVSFAPYFLLYRGAKVKRVLTASGVTMFDVTHVCSYAYHGGLGWNAVWRHSLKAYAPIYNKDGDVQYPYPWASFNL